MKWRSPLTAFIIGAGILSACGAAAPSYACSDRLGCVEIAPGESIRIGTLLTLTTPDSPYGIDALRGAEIAVAQKGPILGRNVEVIKEDDLCSEDGGRAGATRLAADPKIVGVIGTSLLQRNSRSQPHPVRRRVGVDLPRQHCSLAHRSGHP